MLQNINFDITYIIQSERRSQLSYFSGILKIYIFQSNREERKFKKFK